MIRRSAILFLALTVLIRAAAPALAGGLVIEVTARAVVDGPRVKAAITVTNKGDEPVLNVRAEAPGSAATAGSRTVERIQPDVAASLKLDLPRPADGPGRYTAPILVTFHNLDGRRFSALAGTEYFLGSDAPSPLIVQADPLELPGRGRLKVRLLNPRSEASTTSIRLYTPLELSATPAETKTTVPARGDSEVEFELTNLTGQTGADYPVLIAVEHILGGLHAAKLAQVMVSLTDPNPFRRHLGWWLAALGGLLVWLAVLQLKARHRNRRI